MAVQKSSSTPAAAKAANVRLPDDLYGMSEQLRAIEGLADRLTKFADAMNGEPDTTDAVDGFAIAIRSLTYHAGIIVDRQYLDRGYYYRGCVDVPAAQPAVIDS